MSRLLNAGEAGIDFSKPILLRSHLQSLHGIPLMTSTFPYGAWIPNRTALEAIEVNAGGECYFRYEAIDDQFLEAGSSPSVVEFSADSIVSGDLSLWDLLNAGELRLGPTEGALVVTSPNKFLVLTFEDLLHGSEAKACWLTLVLDFERAVLTALKPVGLRALQHLKGKRLSAAYERLFARDRLAKGRKAAYVSEKAAKAALERFLNLSDSSMWFVFDMLENTMLCDKKVMARKQFGLSKNVETTFDRAEQLRNWCAHPSSVAESHLESLADIRNLIQDLETLTLKLKMPS